MNTFFYDNQIRRFLTQFIRIMSNFTVEFGQDRTGNSALQQVPVYYGDSSSQAAQIIMGNSENTLPTCPAMACYISALDYDRGRVQEPYHLSKVQIREREYDPTSGTFGNGAGDAFTVERPMPAPYKLTLKVDIWTSNTQQKLQILEQMIPLFNPAFEIQSTDNYVDWTSLSAIFLTGTTWTSRQVPVGANQTIDIATLTFELPIWISLPIKVRKMGVIQKIIASMYDDTGQLAEDLLTLPTQDRLAQIVVTPLNYGVVFLDNVIQLFEPTSTVTETIDTIVLNTNGDSLSWLTLVDLYGATLINGTTQFRLDQPNGSVVVGTVAYHPTDSAKLLFTPFADTIPSSTLPPINAIIDPYNLPVDSTFINAVTGTRYLILNNIGDPSNLVPAAAWHGSDGSNLVAQANDIIQFDGVKWYVDFSASNATNIQYVTNLKSNIQFKWDPNTQSWSKSVEGIYQPGDWTIVLTS
jgi:hypothetical protein